MRAEAQIVALLQEIQRDVVLIKEATTKSPMEQFEQNMEAFDGLLTTLEGKEEGETNDK